MANWFSWLLNADDAVLLWLNSWHGHWPAFDFAMAQATYMLTIKFGVVAALLIWLWIAPGEQQGKTRQTIVKAVATGFAALLLARALALLLPFRLRPFARADLGFVVPDGFDAGLRTWSAFPSDHAVMAFALATGIWCISKRLGVLAYLHAACVICLPRIYMGLHHPTDVIGGAFVGIGTWWLLSHWRVSDAISRHALTLQAARPYAFYAVAGMTLYETVTMFGGVRRFAVLGFELLHGAVRVS
jgi:undecaprenyl-diphosphatase